MKFDQDLCLNLQYDFGKMNSTLGSVVPLAMFIIQICLTIEFFQTIDVNLLIKHSLVLDIFLSIIEIYLSNIHHHELNINKSINRKIAIILTAKFNRIMLKEIFALVSTSVY